MKKKKKKYEKRNGGKTVRWWRLEDKRRPRSADETANKAIESRIYIKVNMKTSNEHYVLITRT